MDWAGIAAIGRDIGVPVLVKGITTPDAARLALQHGIQGVIVSHYNGRAGSENGAAVLALPAIVDAVGSQVTVLVDGSFRRGTDILKALALGARAVLVGRPAMWGLAGIWRRWRARRRRDAADRAGPLHGDVRAVESADAGPFHSAHSRCGVQQEVTTIKEGAVGPIERRWRQSSSRRSAIAKLAGLVAASPLLSSGLAAQLDPRPLSEHKRTPGLDEMTTAFDFEPVMFAQHSALRLRLHGARRWLGVHAAPQSPGVRLGRSRARRGQSIRRRSISRARSSA